MQHSFIFATPLILLAGCAALPPGPSVMALPGTGVGFEQFRADDYACQGYAANASGTPARQQAASSGVDSAVTGAALGAAAGALIGAATGDSGAGAAIGAGSGLILGGAAGADAYGLSGATVQQRYDNAYVQCMYAKGHQVPIPAGMAANPAQPATSGPAASYPAVPPPGTAPPPGY
jgi:hypothetical protein